MSIWADTKQNAGPKELFSPKKPRTEDLFLTQYQFIEKAGSPKVALPCKKVFYFMLVQSRFRFIVKLRRRYRDFPYTFYPVVFYFIFFHIHCNLCKLIFTVPTIVPDALTLIFLKWDKNSDIGWMKSKLYSRTISQQLKSILRFSMVVLY